MMEYLSPLDAGLMEVGAQPSYLQFPPPGWKIVREWGLGYALTHSQGLRAIIDCSQKSDQKWWVHISVSRATRAPSHAEMAMVHKDFLNDRYAYSVFAPAEMHVNIHEYCLHLWCLCDAGNGLALPEFSEVLPAIGRSI